MLQNRRQGQKTLKRVLWRDVTKRAEHTKKKINRVRASRKRAKRNERTLLA